MKEKKKSAVSWILEWAGQKRSAYVWSVVLAVGNVIFKIIPYFIIANVITMFLDGSNEFKEYLIKASRDCAVVYHSRAFSFTFYIALS